MALSEEQKKKIEERRQVVKRRTEAGRTAKQIADELKVTVETIENDKYILIHKNELKSGDVILEEKTLERRMEVKKRIERGETIQQIAKQLGVSRVTISKDKKYLIDNNMLQQLSKEARQGEIERLTKAGKTEKQIAEQLEVSIVTVKRDKKELINQKKYGNRLKNSIY